MSKPPATHANRYTRLCDRFSLANALPEQHHTNTHTQTHRRHNHLSSSGSGSIIMNPQSESMTHNSQTAYVQHKYTKTTTTTTSASTCRQACAADDILLASFAPLRGARACVVGGALKELAHWRTVWEWEESGREEEQQKENTGAR